MQSLKSFCVAALCIALGSQSTEARDLYIDPADDTKYFGDGDDILTWTPEQQVSGYRNIERISPARKIQASTAPLILPRDERDLGGLVINGSFEEQPFTLTLDEYARRQNVAGLLVIRHGAIFYERYGLGNTDTSRWVSFSISKSVVSLLFGAALRDGYIESIDETVVDYLPRLDGSPYEQTTIENLLHMASGVAWNEDYDDPESDVSQATWESLALYDYLRDKPRVAPAGTVFNYNTAETNLAGNVLRAAIGNNLSTYLHHKIWQPFGMEHDAWWPLTEDGGGEFGACCLAATLRDFGRIGLFALRGGRLADGTEVLPDGWMEASTTPSATAEFYGYSWWLRENGAYQAAGIFGQGIHIDPTKNVVIAVQSAWPTASDQRDWAMQNAMFEAITAAVAAP